MILDNSMCLAKVEIKNGDKNQITAANLIYKRNVHLIL